MAQSKKSAAKKKTAPKKSTKSSKANKPEALSSEERMKLIKPIDGFTELTEQFAQAWTDVKHALSIKTLTPSKLKAALEKAKRSAAKEQALQRKFEEQMRPLMDARLQAEHDVWKMVLDVYAVAKAQTRVHPEIGRAFEFMSDAMKKRSKKKGEEG